MDNQWQTSCTKLEQLIQKISDKIQETCSAPPLPNLTNYAAQQRGFLPRKIQKKNGKNTSPPNTLLRKQSISQNT
jgi:hypothetical protein